MNITFGDTPVHYLNGIDLSMMFRICEARYSTSPIHNLTLTQTHTTSDVIPAMLNVVPHIHIMLLQNLRWSRSKMAPSTSFATSATTGSSTRICWWRSTTTKVRRRSHSHYESSVVVFVCQTTSTMLRLWIGCPIAQLDDYFKVFNERLKRVLGSRKISPLTNGTWVHW